MTDSRTLYATLLGITEPWGVELVEMKQELGEVHVTVALASLNGRPEALLVDPRVDPASKKRTLLHSPIREPLPRAGSETGTAEEE